MRSTKCRKCGNETFQKDICVLCQTGITQMYEELMDLLKKDREQNAPKKKHKIFLPRLNYNFLKRNGKRPGKCRGSVNQ